MNAVNAAPASAPADPLTSTAQRLQQELQDLERSARATAKKRLAGSRLQKLLDQLPGTLEREVDALLGRAGLVRKSRVVVEKTNTPAPIAVVEAAADVDAAPAVEADEVEAPATGKRSRRR